MDRYAAYGGLVEEADAPRWFWEAASQVMQVRTARRVDDGVSQAVGRPTPSGVEALELRGKLLVDSEQAYGTLSERLREQGYVLLLRREAGEDVLLALAGELPRSSGRRRTAAAFFAATVVSVLAVGAFHANPDAVFGLFVEGPSLGGLLAVAVAGWPFAASLLGILIAHEMGHYLVARWQRMPASLPYFIPFPLPPFGTMGAIIRAAAPPRNRRALLLLGASGPLAGLLVAIPVLILGLHQSQVVTFSPFMPYTQEGNSLLYAGLKFLIFGRFLPSGNLDVNISPVAFAGWAGLLITGMNLIPAGQLDGGHIAYALLGRHARVLSLGVVVALLGLSLLWRQWLLWGVLVLLLGRVHSVPLDDVTPLRRRELLLGALAFLVFVLVFIPIPLMIY